MCCLVAWKKYVDYSHMIIDDDTLKQLLRINDGLLQLCEWQIESTIRKPHLAFYPLVDDLTRILIEAGKNKLH